MPALIFDLGALVDTVYPHIYAWQRALAEAELPIEGWKIHRRIGMSGGLLTRALARELGRPLTPEEADAVQARHGELFRENLPEPGPLPGAVELLTELREGRIPHEIATSGRVRTSIPRWTRSVSGPRRSSSRAATSAGEARAGSLPHVRRTHRRRPAGLLCRRRRRPEPPRGAAGPDAQRRGGYGEDDLTRAGAFRVYRDAAELKQSLDELGVVP